MLPQKINFGGGGGGETLAVVGPPFCMKPWTFRSYMYTNYAQYSAHRTSIIPYAILYLLCHTGTVFSNLQMPQQPEIADIVGNVCFVMSHSLHSFPSSPSPESWQWRGGGSSGSVQPCRSVPPLVYHCRLASALTNISTRSNYISPKTFFTSWTHAKRMRSWY